MSSRRGVWGALFRLALLAHPPTLRERYGAEAGDAFVAGVRRRRREGGRSAALIFAARGLADAVTAGVRERRGASVGRFGTRAGALDSFLQDVRGVARKLVRAPGFTATVVVILALGVGANTAAFTVLRAAILAPLPFPESDRLVLPRWTVTAPEAVGDTVFGMWSYPVFADFRDGEEGVFDGLAAYAARSAAVTDPGQAEPVTFEFVTPGYFDVLGVAPVMGRFFVDEEEGRDAAPGVVVLSHAFWTERFGADPGVLGRTVTADGARLEVVGVAAAGFRGMTGSAKLWIPVGGTRAAYGAWAMEGRTSQWLHAVGRLRPGVDAGAGERRVAGLARAVDAVESRAVPPEEVGLDLTPLRAVHTTPAARTSLWVAMAAALLVLGIAVANVVALLLARGRRERRETAVRLALGAEKGRLVRGRLVEGLLLAGLGGGLGLGLAILGVAAVREALPPRLLGGAGGNVALVGIEAVRIDPVVGGFGLAVALLAGAVFGVAPTLLQGAVDLTPSLRQGRGGTPGRGVRDASRWLVGAQVALSVVLLVGAGLLLGTLGRLHDEQRGFDPDGLLVLRYSLGTDAKYADFDAIQSFHRSFRERISALPGVRTAGMGTMPPLGGRFMLSHVTEVVGREPFEEGRRPVVGVHVVDDAYFDAAGTRLEEGRAFRPSEAGSADPVIVISRRAAGTLFPGETALGQEVRVGFDLGTGDVAYRVVGVVEDVLYGSPVEGPGAEIYLPTGVWSPPTITALVRTDGNPSALVPAARDVLASLDPELPFWQVTTGQELRRGDVADTRLMVGVLGVFAALALLLSMTGLWAVVARAVAERRREIGLRVALGARVGQVEGLVFRQALVPILAGGATGAVLAAAAAPRLDAVLFGIAPRSPAVFLAVGALLTGVALLATWLPARGAARVDPMEALGSD